MDKLMVAFRLDAGRIYGTSMGHAYRCAALKKALSAHGPITVRACGIIDPSAAAFLEDRCIEVSSFTDASAADACFATDPAPLKITDLADLVLAKARGETTSRHAYHAVIDDFGAFKGDTDMLIDPLSIETGATASDRLSGLRYAVLNGAATQSGNSSPRHNRSHPLVTMSFGGSDPSDLTVEAVRALSGFDAADVQVCVGPAYGGTARLGRALESHLASATLLEAPADLHGLFTVGDLAVAAGGLTALELAALGVPAVLVPTRESEEIITGRLHDAGCAVMLSRADIARLPDVIGNLLQNDGKREGMAARGPAVVDFGGAARIAEAMIAGMTAKLKDRQACA